MKRKEAHDIEHIEPKVELINYKIFFGISLISLYFLGEAFLLYMNPEKRQLMSDNYTRTYYRYQPTLREQFGNDFVDYVLTTPAYFSQNLKSFGLGLCLVYTLGSVAIVGSLTWMGWILMLAHCFQMVLKIQQSPTKIYESLNTEDAEYLAHHDFLMDLGILTMLFLVVSSVMHPKIKQEVGRQKVVQVSGKRDSGEIQQNVILQEQQKQKKRKL
ncbi:UNKNOWN [Stylonychia lemnae]|uniref:Uncharacterized protein n=1 Tax=Stylonychia lemnae TaxID=5949 RepID=A0A078ATA9_STYLE|nr:UNKNOWN [Stylonychia lemnae]|eukprot:CDW84407.1 UNKNOWN [Stylonychia lemnae]